MQGTSHVAGSYANQGTLDRPPGVRPQLSGRQPARRVVLMPRMRAHTACPRAQQACQEQPATKGEAQSQRRVVAKLAPPVGGRAHAVPQLVEVGAQLIALVLELAL